MADCQTAYRELSTTVFGKPSSGEFRYKIAALESSIKSVVFKAMGSESTQLFDEREDRCHTFVVAKRDLAHESPPVLFRSYKFQGTEITCSVLQAARATSAALTFFPPITIDGNSYVDGGIGFNNPAQEALREARRKWPDRQIGCLTSIGTGLMEPISGSKGDGQSVIFSCMRLFVPLTAEKLTAAKYCSELALNYQSIHHGLREHQSLKNETNT